MTAPRQDMPALENGTLDLTVQILAHNETRHLRRCIESLRGLARRVVVIDSHSTDGTVELARELGADVFSNSWVNYATQYNWGLDHAGIGTQWVMRLDADEVALPNLARWLRAELPRLGPDVAGVTVRRQIHFLGRWIRHGDIYPRHMLRLWRNGLGRCEQRWMDEHIVVQGRVIEAAADIADINLNNIGWWIDKHNGYATREVIDILLQREQARKGLQDQGTAGAGGQAGTVRWLKQGLYGRLPLGTRAFGYFIYRYLFRLGLLDGWPGLAFHVLQGFWYRFLVDVKLWEVERVMRERRCSLAEVILAEYEQRIE
jgi:glycosyltransferase involved in cell wall biosynthesis